MCVNSLVDAALRCRREAGRYAYVAPLYNQAKDVAWEYLKRYALPVDGTTAHESELRVDFPNGARVRLYGGDNPDRLRGIYLDGVVLDEPAQMDPRLWPEVIRPSLADRGGWAIFIGTPMGRNDFAKLYEAARTDDAWYTAILKASETGTVSEEELTAARAVMTADQYAQEFECSFDAAVPGAYYAALITAAEEAKRIGRVPYDPAISVTTAWDLGVGDDTAIWFCQQVGREIHVIDYYEARGQGLDHFAKLLAAKPYAYARHILPHDAEARELGTGKTRIETLRSLGVGNLTTLAALAVDDGINAVRLILPRCWIDAEKCANGIEAMRQYRSDYDAKRKVFRPYPLHDWTSHAADAFRYLALGLKRDESRKTQPIAYPDKGRWIV